jgi:hypothetical protein
VLVLEEVEGHEWPDVGVCDGGVGQVGDRVAGVADRGDTSSAVVSDSALLSAASAGV